MGTANDDTQKIIDDARRVGWFVFPMESSLPSGGKMVSNGMMMRQHYATHAMAAMMANPDYLTVVTRRGMGEDPADKVAEMAFHYADAMIKASAEADQVPPAEPEPDVLAVLTTKVEALRREEEATADAVSEAGLEQSTIARSLAGMIREWMKGPNPLVGAGLERVIEKRLARFVPAATMEGAEPAAYMCAGCGRMAKDADADLTRLRAAGALSCCPERKPIPLYTHPAPSSPTLEAAEQIADLRALAKRAGMDEARTVSLIARGLSVPPTLEADGLVTAGYLFELCYSHEQDRWSGTMFSDALPNAKDIRNVRSLVSRAEAAAAITQLRERVAELEALRDETAVALSNLLIKSEAAEAKVLAQAEALGDLMTWFPKEPSKPEWRLAAGEYGADDAIAAARAAISNEGAALSQDNGGER